MGHCEVQISPALSKLLPGEPDDLISTGLRVGVALSASIALHSLLRWTWEKSTGDVAPTNPSKPGVGWREALIWGVLSGALAGMVKVAARRGTDRFRA